LSPILFTFYLANALKGIKDNKYIPPHLKDHEYTDKLETNINIDQQFADDLSWLSISNQIINSIRKEAAITLKKET